MRTEANEEEGVAFDYRDLMDVTRNPGRGGSDADHVRKTVVLDFLIRLLTGACPLGCNGLHPEPLAFW